MIRIKTAVRHCGKAAGITPLRVAVLGSGAVTNVLYRPALQEIRDEIELMGLAELKQQSAAQSLEEFPSGKFFTKYHANAGGASSRCGHRGRAPLPAQTSRVDAKIRTEFRFTSRLSLAKTLEVLGSRSRVTRDRRADGRI
jgi:hypothetical protein